MESDIKKIMIITFQQFGLFSGIKRTSCWDFFITDQKSLCPTIFNLFYFLQAIEAKKNNQSQWKMHDLFHGYHKERSFLFQCCDFTITSCTGTPWSIWPIDWLIEHLYFVISDKYIVKHTKTPRWKYLCQKTLKQKMATIKNQCLYSI